MRLRYRQPPVHEKNGDDHAFALAQQYGLSVRELEVALLLAEAAAMSRSRRPSR